MAVYKILTFPHPFLKTKAKPVTEFDDELKNITDTMIETLYENSGVGLAAVQVGLNKRLFVMDVNNNNDLNVSERRPTIIVNPEIVAKSDEQVGEERCLSVPDFSGEVKRYSKLTLKYQDLKGNPHEINAEGLLAVCIQHELDHLDGKLFIDLLPPLQRKIVKTKLKKQASTQ